MATVTVYTYRCPRCRADIGRNFGLITSRVISCHSCGSKVRVDANVIGQNWGYNFAWTASLMLWSALAVAVLANPAFAAMIGNGTFPAATFENRLVIAGVCVIPALMGGLVIGGVGMLLGTIVAACSPADGAEVGDFPSSPTQGQGPAGGLSFLPVPAGQQRSQPSGAGLHPPMDPTASPPRARERAWFVRACFVLLWPVVFFVGAAMALNIAATTWVKTDEPPPVVGARTVGLMGSPLGQGPLLAVSSLLPDAARDEPLKQQAAEKMGEKSAPWLLLGTLIVFVLGCVGLLPSTGRKIRRQAPTQPGGGVAARQTSSPAWGIDLKNYPITYGPEPKPRWLLVRGFFVLLWPTVFFFAAALTMAALAGGFSAENEEVRKQIGEQSAQANVGWILLVSLLVFVSGCLGVLPWTGAKKSNRAAAQAE